MINKKVDDQDLMVAQPDGVGDRERERERASFGLFLTQRASFGAGKKEKKKYCSSYYSLVCHNFM
jgi:hypothetical protein